MKITIYHNPRCSKSREALSILERAGTPLDIVEYLKEPPTIDELKEILKKLDMSAHELARKGEGVYKENNADALSDDELIDLMAKNPILIERPILVVDNRALVGRPPEKVKELL